MGIKSNQRGAHPRRRRAVALVYAIVSIIVLTGFCSLAVDLGRVQACKTQLERAASAAARAAAANIANGVSSAQTAAVNMAAANKANGSAVSIDSNNDVTFGAWDTSAHTFTPLSGAARANANAIKVTASLTAAKSNAVPLLFGQVIGLRTCNVTASATAMVVSSSSTTGFIGLSSISNNNNSFIASYNSANTTTPSQSSYNSNGNIASNGTVDMSGTEEGNITIGPSGNVSNSPIDNGSIITLATAIPTPAQKTWNPSTNPNSTPQSYTFSSNTTLPGGTYWFTSLGSSNNKTLTFSGPTTIYLNGDTAFGQGPTITPSSGIPSDLKIYIIGAHSFGDSSTNNMNITAYIEGPTASFAAKNNAKLYGAAVFDTMSFKNNLELYYDEAFGSGSGGSAGAISVVK